MPFSIENTAAFLDITAFGAGLFVRFAKNRRIFEEYFEDRFPGQKGRKRWS
jgi:hypothetical protein